MSLDKLLTIHNNSPNKASRHRNLEALNNREKTENARKIGKKREKYT
jgi:hypothetical protein